MPPAAAYTREEILHREFTDLLRRMVIPEPVLKWLGEELDRANGHEACARQRTIKSWQDESDRLQGRLEAMYEDKLDGRITPEQHDRKAKDARSRQEDSYEDSRVPGS